MEKRKHETAAQLFKELLESAGDALVYDTVVSEIVKKFGSDQGFIKAVVAETGIPEEVVTKEIIDAASVPEKPIEKPTNHSPQGAQEADPDGAAPIKQQEQPAMPPPNSPAPGLGQQSPDIAQPQSAAPPQTLQAGAAANQAKGMSPGQALNVANQAPKPMMKKGGLLTKPKMEYGGSPDGGVELSRKDNAIGLKDGGDVGEPDLTGSHSPGMLGGGLMTLPNYNNSVEMDKGGDVKKKDWDKRTPLEKEKINRDDRRKRDYDMDYNNGVIADPETRTRRRVDRMYHDDTDVEYKGVRDGKVPGTKDEGSVGLPKGTEDENRIMGKVGKKSLIGLAEGGVNDPPPGALPEEVADDQPVMLSKGEFVFPANVVRFIGLEALMKIRDKALIGLAKMDEAGQIRRPGDGKNPGEEGEVAPKPILNGESSAHEMLEKHAIESIEEHAELLEDLEEQEDPDELYLKNGGSIANLNPKSTLALKTSHLRHNKTYGHNSGMNNLSESVSGGGPNEPGMKSGGVIPPDNTTGIDPAPTARRNAATPEGRGIGRNLGKRPFKQAKGNASVEGKGVLRPFRKMAEGGDVSDIEEAGRYLNTADSNDTNEKEAHRDNLPGYENFGDWARAVTSTPNIFGLGVVSDAIQGKGMFNNNWNQDYLTTKELREGQTHVGKGLLNDPNEVVPEYDDAKNKENNDDIMNAYGGQSTEGKDKEVTSAEQNAGLE